MSKEPLNKLTQVFLWYERAASSNCSEGLYHLAWAYHHGMGTERNVSRAAELYRKAIKMGWLKKKVWIEDEGSSLSIYIGELCL
jgi:TPR repeat protein